MLDFEDRRRRPFGRDRWNYALKRYFIEETLDPGPTRYRAIERDPNF